MDDTTARAILEKLEALETRLVSIDKTIANHGAILDRIHKRAVSHLFLSIMDRIAPSVLDALMPPVAPSLLGDLTGFGELLASRWLRDSVGRALSGLGTSMTGMAPEEREKLVQRGVEISSFLGGSGRGEAYRVYLEFLLYGLYRKWEYVVPIGQDFVSHCRDLRTGSVRLAWAIALAAFAETGCEEEAAHTLSRYREYYGECGLEQVPYAAYHANRLGGLGEKSDFVASMVREVRGHANSGFLAEFLAGKSVAVVGRGPQEKGKARGKEIDDHDIVVRVNHRPSPAYYADYGSRTDVLYCAAPSLVDENPGRFAVLATFMLEHIQISPRAICQWKQILDHRKFSLVTPTRENLRDLFTVCEELRVRPTSGMVVLAWMKNLIPALSVRDVYGFSHCGTIPKKVEHFDGTVPVWDKLFSVHDLEREKLVFERILGVAPRADDAPDRPNGGTPAGPAEAPTEPGTP
ncbi:MAG: glycosyltransferase family 29 protein [Planctomycetes bacterium]|nr:glycosyltransferase family 29 protein [Planctomycetota bacterium]